MQYPALALPITVVVAVMAGIISFLLDYDPGDDY